MNWKLYYANHKEHILTFIALLAVSIVSFGTFRSAIISSDDWSYIVEKFAFGNLHPIDLNDRRPFVVAFYYFMASVFGLKFEYYYFANFLILLFSAYLVFIILKQAFPKIGWLASLAALVYLIYPVDYSRTWFIMIYIRLVWMIGLAAIWLLLEFTESGKWWIFVAAMIAISIPLGAYEGQFGVIALMGVLISVVMPGLPLKRRLALLGGILLIGISFLVWRFFIQENVLNIQDPYVGSLQYNPAILMGRYFEGLDIFVRGWLVPVQAQLRLSGFELPGLWLLWIIFGYLAVLWVFSKRELSDRFNRQQRISKIKPLWILFLIGGAFWVAGYIPIIVLYPPSLSGHASRVNLFAIPGASLMLVSAISILAAFVTRSVQERRAFVTVVILPFIIAGVFVQLQVNHENRLAWETQKKIWNSVFELIPNIAEDKRVVVIIPGYQQPRPFESLPFLAGWEIETGTRVLYNNQNIGGNYYYKDIQPSTLLFTKNGFRPIPTDKIIPYKKLIFVYYNPKNETAELVENLEETLSLPFPANNYSPHENIIPAQPSTAEFRWLVQ